MAGYSRQSAASIVPTAVVRATPLNDEFNALRDAFVTASGHKHDGTATEGAYVPLISDTNARNKVVVDSANNRLSLFVNVSSAAAEQLRVVDGAFIPVVDNDVDLGSATFEFKDLFIDGTANIDSLIADTAAISGGTINNTVIGNTTPNAVTGTTITATVGFVGGLTGNITGNVTGNVTGNLTGDVTGNVTGNITGNVTGNVTASSGTSTFNNVTVNGTLNMDAGTAGTITNLSTPTNSGDAATKGYVDTADALKLNLSGGTMSGAIAMGTNKITGLGTPTDNNDAATKVYVDNAIQGIDAKASVKAATTTNISLSGTQTIDGVSVIAGDRVLVKDQSTSSQNGIYIAAASTWSRAADANAWDELVAAYVFVEGGTANGNNGYLCTVAAGGTIDSTAVTFVQFSGAGQITAGTGMTKSGNTLNVNTASSARIVVGADEIDLATTGVSAGTYRSVTTDIYGRITAGTNPTTISGYGITDAYTKTEVDTSLSGKLNLTGGTMTGNIVMGANKVTSTATPTTDDDLTRKAYVDSILGSATSAAASAAAAAVSESNAATSASNASTSASSAASSASAAAASYDSFDDRYLGSNTSDPTLDNDGNALLTGALYWNSTAGEMRVWNGSTWIASYLPASGYATLTGSETLTNKTLVAPVNLASSTSTQDGVIVTGRAGGTSSFRVTVAPTTLTASRAQTLPDAAGTFVLDSAAQTLTNKTLTSPVISSISNTGTLTLPTSTDTLVGRATTDTLTNKTVVAPVVLASATTTQDGVIVTGRAGGASSFRVTVAPTTLTASRVQTLPDAAGTFVLDSAAQTLTNKTLTSPIISSISNTGTLTLPTSTDTLVGRATTDTLTNKTLTSPIISSIVNTGTLTLPTSTDTLVGRATTDTLTNKTISGSSNTITNLQVSSFNSGSGASSSTFWRGDGTWAAAGLTNFSEQAISTAPNATVPAVQLFINNAASNADLVVSAKGTGAVLAQVPNSSSTGGNKRGQYALDLQRTRSLASQVALGNYSVIPGGANNTANGAYAFGGGQTAQANGDHSFAYGSSASAGASGAVAMGVSSSAQGVGAVAFGGGSASANYAVAIGSGCGAQGTGAFAAGVQSFAEANYSVVFSDYSTARSVPYTFARNAQSFNRVAQKAEYLLWGQVTTGNTSVNLTAGNTTVSSTTIPPLVNHSVRKFWGRVTAFTTQTSRPVTAWAKSWVVEGMIVRGNGAGTTTLIGTPTVTVDFEANNTNTSGWTIAATADTTNGGLLITLSGATEFVNATAVIEMIEIDKGFA